MPKKKRSAKAELQAQRRAKERAELEKKRVEAREAIRWSASLRYLDEKSAKLRENPWLIIFEPKIIQNYLDSLTEVLAKLPLHEDELDEIRVVLQGVYAAFVDIGQFAENQAGFYIDNAHTIRRFVRLLHQVAHSGSDKALLPTVLSMLRPTFTRREVYSIFAESNVCRIIMSFCHPQLGWTPLSPVLNMMLSIMEDLVREDFMRDLIMAEPGFGKFKNMSQGLVKGMTLDQQMRSRAILEGFPQTVDFETDPEEDKSFVEEMGANQDEKTEAAPEPLPANTERTGESGVDGSNLVVDSNTMDALSEDARGSVDSSADGGWRGGDEGATLIGRSLNADIGAS